MRAANLPCEVRQDRLLAEIAALSQVRHLAQVRDQKGQQRERIGIQAQSSTDPRRGALQITFARKRWLMMNQQREHQAQPVCRTDRGDIFPCLRLGHGSLQLLDRGQRMLGDRTLVVRVPEYPESGSPELREEDRPGSRSHAWREGPSRSGPSSSVCRRTCARLPETREIRDQPDRPRTGSRASAQTKARSPFFEQPKRPEPSKSGHGRGSGPGERSGHDCLRHRTRRTPVFSSSRQPSRAWTAGCRFCVGNPV